jgi:hypothetical protein
MFLLFFCLLLLKIFIMSDKKINEIDIDSLIKTVYNKIVTWHNDDATPQGLKHLSIEIIQDCTNNTLKQIGLEDIVTDVKIEK